MKHTPEPWFDHRDYNYMRLKKDDYSRAVSCVNALSGIEDVKGFMENMKRQLNLARNCEDIQDMYNDINEALSLFPTKKESKQTEKYVEIKCTSCKENFTGPYNLILNLCNKCKARFDKWCEEKDANKEPNDED